MTAIPFPENPVLLVDDEPAVADGLSLSLQSSGITNVRVCSDSRQVMGILGETAVEVVLLDLTMPHLTGRELLGSIRESFPEVPVIVVTVTNEVATAVECMKAGAFDYLVKAVESSRLVSCVSRAVEIRRLRREVRDLTTGFREKALRCPEAFAPILTRDRSMHALFLTAEAVARTSEPVLITGESGVGKNLLARAIHDASGRTGKFVQVSIAGIDDTMIASEMFGHLKGAFTGAGENREGMVQQARGGTLFLDEIGDLSASSQIKLLRLLDTREYQPLGSDLPKRSDARVVAATNRDLQVAIADGMFRRDLFYRLSTYELAIPPLRERKGDLPLLLDHFLNEAAAAADRSKPAVPPELLALLRTYDFPANVRDVRKMAINAVSLQSSNVLALGTFKTHMGLTAPATPGAPSGELLGFKERLPTLEQARWLLTSEALRRSQDNHTTAASLLGITRQALERWLRDHRPT